MGHPTNGHGPPPRPFARLADILRPERGDLMAVAFFAIGVAVLSLATPIAVESLVNTVAFGVLLWPVLTLAGVLTACLGLAAAIRAMQVYVVECLLQRLFVRVLADYSGRLPRVQLEALDGRHGPELANRFFDVLTVQKSLATLLLDGVAVVVMAGVGMAVLAFYHPFLLGFDIILLALIAFAVFGLGVGGVRTSLQESHAKYDVAAWVEELLRAPRAFRFAGGAHFALEKADRLADEYISARRGHFSVVWRQTLFSLLLQVVASAGLLGLGGFLVINQQLTLGQLVASELIVALVVASVAKLGKYAETFYDLMAGAEKLGVLADLPAERDGGEALPDGDRGVSLRVRGFSGVPHRLTAPQADWHAAPNEWLAVVGPPGSGKTTLFEVLCGLREPGHGVVEIDGVDRRGLAPARLREQIALVDGPALFLGTVLENVRVGRPHLSPAEVRGALEAVGLLGLVHALPGGLDAELTPYSGPLSRSQATRLTFARALAGRPRLLVVDGALDAAMLQDFPRLADALFDRSAPCTLLVATDCPAVIARCDRVVYVDRADPAGAPPPPEHDGALR